MVTLSASRPIAFSTVALSGLSTGQVSGLTSTQVGQLTTTAINALSTLAMGHLTSVQLDGLRTTQIAAMSTANFGALTSAQLGSLATTQIAAFSTTNIAGLTTGQFSGISSTQLSGMTTAQQQHISTLLLQGELGSPFELLARELVAISLFRAGPVMICEPGQFETDMGQALINDKAALQAFLKTVPLQRLGRPREIGVLAVTLASDASAFMTGQVVVLDGGASAH